MKFSKIFDLRPVAILFLLSIIIFNCKGTDSENPAEPAAANYSGTWAGTITSNMISTPAPISITIFHTNNSITGSYEVITGASGTVAGSVNKNAITFTLTQTTQGCTGSFSGQGTFNGTSMIFTYSGNDCWGTHSNGNGNVTKYEVSADVICPLYVGQSWRYIDSNFSSTGAFTGADSSKLGIIAKGTYSVQGQNVELYHWNWINPKTNKPQAYSWLERNNSDGLSLYGGYFRNSAQLFPKMLSIKFPVNAGDTWNSPRCVFNVNDSTFKIADTVKYTSTSVSENFQTPAGVFNCYAYNYQRSYTSAGQTMTDNIYSYYAKNKGYLGMIVKTNGIVRFKKVLKK
ncbi:MAG: hypothetical protein WC061_01765 [Melioribacteraceae bacterium]